MNARTKRIAKDAAKTGWHTLTGIILLALKIIGTILLIFVTTGFIFALIFTMYAKTNLSNPPDVDLSEIAIGLSSEVYYQDRDTGEYKKLKTL
ncbi:MAG: hypothetical protein HUJ65_00660, partial [Oscillospiraceae bacterium]|nr:hypothetical protein [Oscillospiraceae bacterium]